MLFFYFRFSCKGGQMLVSKPDFAAGILSNLVSTVSSTCLISGWFNDTIGGYTCTKYCSEPTNYTALMTYDWDGIVPVPYNHKIK